MSSPERAAAAASSRAPARERPLVLTGAMDRWRAREWTLDWLREQHGGVRFPVSRSYSRASAPTSLELGAYIDLLRSEGGTGGLYLSGVDLLERVPALRADFEFPRWAPWERLCNTLVFIGGAGNLLPLHFDFSHTLLAQVAGRKRVTLFSPRKTPLLAPLPRELFQTFSGLELSAEGEAAPSAARYEEVRREHADHDFTLAPGEILFLPYGWWHGVESLEPSISLSRSWWTLGMLLSQAPHLAADWLRYRWRRARPAKGAQGEPSDWLGF